MYCLVVIALMGWCSCTQHVQAGPCPKAAKIGSSYTITQTVKNLTKFRWEYFDIFTKKFETAAVNYVADLNTRIETPTFESSISREKENDGDGGFRTTLTSGGIAMPSEAIREKGNPSSFLWFVDGKIHGHCDLEMYSMESNPVCGQMAKAGDHVTWMCSISHIYPPLAKCLFQYRKDDGKYVNVSGEHTDAHLFSTGNISSSSYGTTQCVMTIPINTLSPGSYIYKVIVYPDITTNSFALGKSLDSTLLLVANDVDDWSRFGIAGVVLTCANVVALLIAAITIGIRARTKQKVIRRINKGRRKGKEDVDLSMSPSSTSGTLDSLREVNPSSFGSSVASMNSRRRGSNASTGGTDHKFTTSYDCTRVGSIPEIVETEQTSQDPNESRQIPEKKSKNISQQIIQACYQMQSHFPPLIPEKSIGATEIHSRRSRQTNYEVLVPSPKSVKESDMKSATKQKRPNNDVPPPKNGVKDFNKNSTNTITTTTNNNITTTNNTTTTDSSDKLNHENPNNDPVTKQTPNNFDTRDEMATVSKNVSVEIRAIRNLSKDKPRPKRVYNPQESENLDKNLRHAPQESENLDKNLRHAPQESGNLDKKLRHASQESENLDTNLRHAPQESKNFDKNLAPRPNHDTTKKDTQSKNEGLDVTIASSTTTTTTTDATNSICSITSGNDPATLEHPNKSNILILDKIIDNLNTSDDEEIESQAIRNKSRSDSYEIPKASFGPSLGSLPDNNLGESSGHVVKTETETKTPNRSNDNVNINITEDEKKRLTSPRSASATY